jgi:L-ribulose-5-phosphate 3-epimerase/hexulose-6-phosphate isomerase
MVSIHLKDTKPNVFKCVPFGEGTVDFNTFFRKLTHLNYQGPFVIEMWADQTLEEDQLSVINRLIDAKKWLYERM